MNTKFIDLKPKFAKTEDIKRSHIVFDCPKCRKHTLYIPVSEKLEMFWKMTGENFEDISLHPSIAHTDHYADGMDKKPRICESHFFITKGEIEML